MKEKNLPGVASVVFTDSFMAAPVMMQRRIRHILANILYKNFGKNIIIKEFGGTKVL